MRKTMRPAPLAASASVLSSGGDLASPEKKEIAMQLVSSAENSSLDWKKQYAYIEDIGDGRGYTAGIIGFCSGTGDMLELVRAYTQSVPDNPWRNSCPRWRKSTAPIRTRVSARLSKARGKKPRAPRNSRPRRTASATACTSIPR